VLDGQRHLRSNGKQDSQVVRSESVRFGLVKGQYADHAAQAFEREGESRAQGAEFHGIVQIAGLDRRVAVDNRLAILCDPSRETLPYGYAQRFKQTEVVAVNVLRIEHVVAAHVD